MRESVAQHGLEERIIIFAGYKYRKHMFIIYVWVRPLASLSVGPSLFESVYIAQRGVNHM